MYRRSSLSRFLSNVDAVACALVGGWHRDNGCALAGDSIRLMHGDSGIYTIEGKPGSHFMHWILLGVIALALVVTAVRSPRLAFAILVVLIGGAVLMLQLIPGERERESARMSVSDVQLLMAHVIPAYAGGFDLRGRLENRSDDAELSEATIEVQLRDCHNDSDRAAGNCPVLGVATPQIALIVPPRQARDFSVSITFPRVQVRGEADWQYIVRGVRGHRYQPTSAQ